METKEQGTANENERHQDISLGGYLRKLFGWKSDEQSTGGNGFDKTLSKVADGTRYVEAGILGPNWRDPVIFGMIFLNKSCSLDFRECVKL